MEEASRWKDMESCTDNVQQVFIEIDIDNVHTKPRFVLFTVPSPQRGEG